MAWHVFSCVSLCVCVCLCVFVWEQRHCMSPASCRTAQMPTRANHSQATLTPILWWCKMSMCLSRWVIGQFTLWKTLCSVWGTKCEDFARHFSRSLLDRCCKCSFMCPCGDFILPVSPNVYTRRLHHLKVSTAGRPIYYVSAKRDVFNPMKLPKYTLPKVGNVSAP